jgi:hypothetical protein
MIRGRRDYVAIALATAGVLAAISLAGIFIVYLIDTIGGDDKPTSAEVVGTTALTSPTTPGLTSPTGPSSPSPGTSAPGAGGAGGAGGSGGAAGNQQSRANLIPDNQQYDTFKGGDWSILYPKGWDAKEFSKVNHVWSHGLDRLTVLNGRGPKPTVASVGVQVGRLKNARVVTPPKEVKVNGKPAIKTTLSEQLKRPGQPTARIYTDDYRMQEKGRTAIITLRCPGGVYKDNQDAFTKMVESFRWQ